MGTLVRMAAAGKGRNAYIHRSSPYSPFAVQGGAGRPGSRPLASDLIARGTKNALLGHFRRPPGAWIGLSTDPAGYRSWTSPHPGSLPRLFAEGDLGTCPASRDCPREHWRLDGLSTNQPKHPNTAPGSCAAARPCREAATSSPGHASYSRTVRRSHTPYAYSMNGD